MVTRGSWQAACVTQWVRNHLSWQFRKIISLHKYGSACICVSLFSHPLLPCSLHASGPAFSTIFAFWDREYIRYFCFDSNFFTFFFELRFFSIGLCFFGLYSLNATCIFLPFTFWSNLFATRKMLLGQLRKARLNGDEWLAQTHQPFTEQDSIPLNEKMTRLSIAPSLLAPTPNTKSSPKRRSRSIPAPDRRSDIASSSKRMKNVGMSFARVVPAQKFPASLLNDRFVSDVSPWDDAPVTPPKSDHAGDCSTLQLDLDAEFNQRNPFAAASAYTPSRESDLKFFPTGRIGRERATTLVLE